MSRPFEKRDGLFQLYELSAFDVVELHKVQLDHGDDAVRRRISEIEEELEVQDVRKRFGLFVGALLFCIVFTAFLTFIMHFIALVATDTRGQPMPDMVKNLYVVLFAMVCLTAGPMFHARREFRKVRDEVRARWAATRKV